MTEEIMELRVERSKYENVDYEAANTALLNRNAEKLNVFKPFTIIITYIKS